MTPERCPGCGTKLTPNLLACPNCPISFPEGDDSSGGLGNPLKQSAYWDFVMPALFFATLAAAVWYIALGLFRLAEDNKRYNAEAPSFLRPPAQARNEATDAAKISGDDVAPAPAPAPAPADADGATTVISITPIEPPGPSVAGLKPSVSARAASEWKLRGRVFDLETLNPLGGVVLELIDERTNARFRTRSDSNGFYRILVPALSGRGYVTTLARDGRFSNFLDPATPSVRALSEVDRRALAKSLSATLTSAPVMIAAKDSSPLITDFYLAPRP